MHFVGRKSQLNTIFNQNFNFLSENELTSLQGILSLLEAPTILQNYIYIHSYVLLLSLYLTSLIYQYIQNQKDNTTKDMLNVQKNSSRRPLPKLEAG